MDNGEALVKAGPYVAKVISIYWFFKMYQIVQHSGWYALYKWLPIGAIDNLAAGILATLFMLGFIWMAITEW